MFSSRTESLTLPWNKKSRTVSDWYLFLLLRKTFPILWPICGKLRDNQISHFVPFIRLRNSLYAFLSQSYLHTYDVCHSGKFQDNETTHFASSFGAGTCATLLSQPIDVFKTRLMNAKPGEFNSFGALIKFTAQSGISGFYKGFIPGGCRE